MKNFLTSCAGTIVGLLLLVVICITWFVSMLSIEKPVVIDDGSVLHIKLDKQITELQVDEPLNVFIPGGDNESIGLMELRDAINHAKDDPKIMGIYLNAPFVAAGFSTLDEVRKSLEDFRETGKWVVAYSDFYTEGGYYLSAAADKVYMNPTGQVELNGLAIEVNFFKKLFDKLEIKPEVFRVGDFKSAVEPFIREDMSEENRLQLTEMIKSIHQHMISELARSRDLPEDRLKEISNKMLVRDSKQAVEFGLLDSLYYDDQVKDELRERLGLEKDKAIPFVKYSDYQKSFSASGSSKNEIAVIVADGDILPGKANNGVVGSSTIREQIRKARTTDRVKAIIIRVNSPGGAFTAADEMWREIYLASQAKPVIASMGDYAASGGYYLAMACDTIVAQPNTITGSIGVFSVLFDLSDFLGDKIGITSEQVKTGEIGDLITVTRSLTPQEKDIWQKQTNEVYEIFTSKAAQGRNMSQDDIKKVASGRVWTGSQALERGLVDKLGTFNDAVQIAAGSAGIGTDYKLRYYPKQKTFLEKLMSDYENEVRVSTLKKETGEYYRWFQQWEKVKHYQGTQARMPVEFIIK
ncbi:MAG TPA: signal peptide peptidase SppA [Cyclobacteriaceae bacterium]|nr:signal peptide peptidase SppA [Cyclobacteriaceae bacterium]